MRDLLSIPKARCAALIEVQRKRESQETVSQSEIAGFLQSETSISSNDAERIAEDVIASLPGIAEARELQEPLPSNASKQFPRVIRRFGEEWRLSDDSEAVALYDCFNLPAGTFRGQVVLVKRWRRKDKKLPSGNFQKAGTPVFPSADDFGQFAWNFQGAAAGRKRFDELKAE